MKKIWLFLLAISVFQWSWATETSKYKVQKGETLYGVALQHRTTIAELKRLNPQIIGTNIHIGDELTVPVLAVVAPATVAKDTAVLDAAIQVTVSDKISLKKEGITPKKSVLPSSETSNSSTKTEAAIVASLAKEVNVGNKTSETTVAGNVPIMKGGAVLNNKVVVALTDSTKKTSITDSIPLKKLKSVKHIVASGETLMALARYYDQSLNDLKKWNELTSYDIKPGQEVTVMWLLPSGEAANVKKTPTKAELINDHRGQFLQMQADTTGKYKRYREEGIGDWFDDAGSGGLYCFHRTAPIQTVIKITNSQNGKSEFVKVVQKLPENVTTEDIGIRFNSTVAKRLGLGDQQRSRFSWQYYLPRKAK